MRVKTLIRFIVAFTIAKIIVLMATYLIGCGDEGISNPISMHKGETLGSLKYETVPAAPSNPWVPDALTIEQLIYPYLARQCIGQIDIIGEEFHLASCEVLYRNLRFRRSEENERWVRLSTGRTPGHATNWTHNRVPQYLYIFLQFQEEDDFQQFQVGTHENVIFTVKSAFPRGKANTWEVHLMYGESAVLPNDTPTDTNTDASTDNDDADEIQGWGGIATPADR